MLTKLDLLYTPNFKRLSELRIAERRAKFAMEQVKVIETSSVEWQSTVLTIVLHLHLEPAGNYDIPTPCLQGKCSAAELCRHGC